MAPASPNRGAQLAGAVALLLWGTHMVTTGVARGFGTELRALIGRGLGDCMSAGLAGLATTAVLKSSTTTALIATRPRARRGAAEASQDPRDAGRARLARLGVRHLT